MSRRRGSDTPETGTAASGYAGSYGLDEATLSAAVPPHDAADEEAVVAMRNRCRGPDLDRDAESEFYRRMAPRVPATGCATCAMGMRPTT